MESGEYAINIPNANLLEQVHYCGTTSGEHVDKFSVSGLTKIAARVIDVPVIDECVGHVECRVVSTHPAGEHTIFVATVVSASAEDTLFDGKWKTGQGFFESLHYLGGTQYALLGETMDAKNFRSECKAGI